MAILNFPPTAGEPIDGSFTYTSDGVTYSWDGYKWTADTGSGGGDANHNDGPTPPITGELADQWYNTDDGRLYTYTADSSGTLVWIDASPDSIGGGSGGSGDGSGGGGADAWGSFNADGTTQGSFNCSAVKGSPGSYVVTFDTPMPNDNYAATATAGDSNNYDCFIDNKVATGFTTHTRNALSATAGDSAFSVAVHASSTVTPTYTWTRDGTTLKTANAGDDIEAAAATFAGNVQSGGFPENGAANGIVMRDAGLVQACRTNTGIPANDVLWAGYQFGATALTSRISADGSAYLAGELSCSLMTGDGPGPVYPLYTGKQAGFTNYKLQANGQILSSITTISPISSERRLKKNIVAIDSVAAWETIKSTPYYTYNFIGQDTVIYGPMADEVPDEMVVQPMEENEAGVMVARSDEEGPIRTFDNGMLQARLYVALQTALTRIETLEETNASLEARLTALEGGTN